MKKIFVLLAILIHINNFQAVDAQTDNIEMAKKLYEQSLNVKDESQKIVLRKEIVNTSPDSEYGHFAQGYLHANNNDNDNAILEYSKAIEINPKMEYAYQNRAGIKFKMNDYLGAIQDSNKVLEINSKNDLALVHRGLAKLRLNDNYGAIADFTKSIGINKNQSDVYYVRGLCYVRLNMVNDAIRDMSIAITNHKKIALSENNYYNSLTLRGTAYGTQKYFKLGISDLTKAISINKMHPRAYISRGSVYNDSGNKVKACLDWSKAGELGDASAYEYINEFCSK
jgi:tetratricopeptide (TPR) repeat protein